VKPHRQGLDANCLYELTPCPVFIGATIESTKYVSTNPRLGHACLSQTVDGIGPRLAVPIVIQGQAKYRFPEFGKPRGVVSRKKSRVESLVEIANGPCEEAIYRTIKVRRAGSE